MALKLRELAYSETYALVGGFDAWVEAGLPLERREAVQPSHP